MSQNEDTHATVPLGSGMVGRSASSHDPAWDEKRFPCATLPAVTSSDLWGETMCLSVTFCKADNKVPPAGESLP